MGGSIVASAGAVASSNTLRPMRDNLDENGAAIRMRAGGCDDMMIALSLGRCKPFLTVPSCEFRVSIATGPGKLQVQPRPQCPDSESRPEKCGLSRRAIRGHRVRARYSAAVNHVRCSANNPKIMLKGIAMDRRIVLTGAAAAAAG